MTGESVTPSGGTPHQAPFRVVGVIHLAALPGTARGGAASALPALIDAAKRDGIAYAAGGADAVILENFGDVPFARDAVSPYVVAAMTCAAFAIRNETDLPLGINVLRNDVLSAVSIAAAVGATFIRANVYVGAALTDQGIIEGRAAEVQALIRRLGVDLEVWADVDVKHAAQLTPRPIGDLAVDAIERGLAGAVIVSGPATGLPASTADLQAVRDAIGSRPLYVGSGTSTETIESMLKWADGVIVGTAAKRDGIVGHPVDPVRVRALVDAAGAAVAHRL